MTGTLLETFPRPTRFARNFGTQSMPSPRTRSRGRVMDAMSDGTSFRAFITLEGVLTVMDTTRIVDFATMSRLPAIYGLREFVDAGGLMSYGPDRRHLFRRSATYVHRILKGAKPADLPVEAPAKFELVINLKTAKALGLTIPLPLLRRADYVIQ